MYPHRIRLRGPWECQPLAQALLRPDGSVDWSTDALPHPCRMTLPCRWGEGGLKDFAGRVRFVRRFGRPARIDAEERLWLTFGGIEGSAEVWLNEQRLGRHEGADGPFDHEVTAAIQERNELAVEVEARNSGGGLWGEVALEIRRTAYLRGVRLEASRERAGTCLHVTGEAVGTSRQPLEVQVHLHEASVARAEVQPTPAGKSFHLRATGLRLESRPGGVEETAPLYRVRIELLQGAVAWYSLEEVLESVEGGRAS